MTLNRRQILVGLATTAALPSAVLRAIPLDPVSEKVLQRWLVMGSLKGHTDYARLCPSIWKNYYPSSLLARVGNIDYYPQIRVIQP